jgi:fructose-1,6-bisphosphatase/sedoheptulose 1,7-bisphosphatase-like protein
VNAPRPRRAREETLPEPTPVDRNLAMEAARITEAAAIAAARFMGRGDEEAADRAAAGAMHEALSRLAINGAIVIGHGGGAEGVLAAAALRCIGGQMQGRLVFDGDDEKSGRWHSGSPISGASIRLPRWPWAT